MTKKINLSYVMTTRNKLLYLKECLPLLLAAVQPDEEIVIVDGASSDGTVEYLQTLYNEKHIHKFLSEPDRGEAHGTNKAILISSGELIKFITDDDVFYWSNIQKCKEFMLSHSEIDILGTEGADADWNLRKPAFRNGHYQVQFKDWLSNGKPFEFGGLGIMIRRNSLPILGLFHTGFIRMDLEFTLRVTSIPANLAWFTGCTFVRLGNPSSNFSKYHKLMLSEEDRLQQFYFPKSLKWNRAQFIGYILKVRNLSMGLILTILHKLFGNNIRQRLFGHNNKSSEAHLDFRDIGISSKMEIVNNWLELNNQQFPGSFLYRSRLSR
jgi:glycosyltransferase involved in cell wall biosynthesis